MPSLVFKRVRCGSTTALKEGGESNGGREPFTEKRKVWSFMLGT